MSLSYRTILSHLLSYRFATPLRPVPLQRDRAKRGGLFEYLETRELFSVDPTVNDFQDVVARNTPFTLAFADFSNNSIPSNELSVIEFTTLPAHGTLTLAGSAITANEQLSASAFADNSIVYTPDNNFEGTDTFQWIGSDDGSNFSTVAANLTMSVADHPPTLSNATKNIVENDSNPFTLTDFTSHFTDLDGDSLQNLTITSLPSNGTITLSGTPITANQTIDSANITNLTYIPNNGFIGTDSFTWNASDGLNLANSTANFTLTVANQPPTASNITIPVAKNANTSLTTSEFAAGFNDSDAPLDFLHDITIVTLPSSGTLTLNGSPVTANQTIDSANITNLVYTAANGFTGTDTFTFQVSDGKVTSANSATASLVITPPTLSTVTTNVLPNSAANGFTVSEFANAFHDLPGFSLQSIEIISLPTHGNLSLNGTPVTANQTIDSANITNLTYTPNANFVGTDIFVWNATDGDSFAAATAAVSIAVDTPPSTTDFSVTGLLHATNIPISLANFTASFTDPDSSIANNTHFTSLQSITITLLPAHGFLTLGGDAGTYLTLGQVISGSLLSQIEYTQTPSGALSSNQNETVISGSDTFGYTVSDGSLSDTTPTALALSTDPNAATDGTAAIVTITATANTSPVVTDIAANTSHVSALTIGNQFTSHYTDADQDPLSTVTFLTLPAHGNLTFISSNTTLPVTVGMTLNPTLLATLQYTPSSTSLFVGNDTFTWSASDNFNNSNTANFTITLTNRAPFNANLTFSAGENDANPFNPAQFAASFVDQDLGDTLGKIEITSLPAHGTLSLNGAPITANQTIDFANISLLTYTPNLNYTGADSFKWVASDGFDFAANGAFVNITVSNQPPVVSNITILDLPGANITLNTSVFAPGFSAHITGASLQAVKIVTLPLHGTLTLSGTPVTANTTITKTNLSNLVYTSTAGFHGTDTFKYNASDFDSSDFAASSANFNINVDTAPTASNATKVGTIGANIAFVLSDFNSSPSIYFDPENDPLASITITTLPTLGTLKLGSSNVTANQTISAANITRLTYTPTTAGTTTFAFTENDGFTSSNSATYTITNHSIPTVTPINFFVQPIIPFHITNAQFTAAFTDVDAGSALTTVEFTTLPAHGNITLSGTPITANQSISLTDIANGSLVYTPTAGFQGNDTFTWSGSAGPQFATAAANITISQAYPTVANVSESGNSTLSGNANNTITFASGDFSNEFSDNLANGNFTSITILSLPANGTLQLSNTTLTSNNLASLGNITKANISNLTYIPDAGSHGPDTFQYNAFDGFDFALTPANVNLTIDTPPTLSDGGPFNETVGTPVVFTNLQIQGVFNTYQDVENDPFSSITITSLPTHGTLQLNGHAVTVNQTVNKSLLANLSYTPTSSGSDTFQFIVSDGLRSSSNATTFSFTNNTRPVVSNISIPASNGNITFNSSEFTAGFIDTDTTGNFTLGQIIITSLPTHGTLTYNGTPVVGSSNLHIATTIDSANISLLVYTPNAGYRGTDSFTWNATDGAINANASATANITIAAPVLANFTLAVLPAGITFTQAEFANPPVFAAVSSAAPAVALRIDTLPKHGTLTLNGTPITANSTLAVGDIPNLTYIPAAGYHGTDSFRFNVKDDIFFATTDATLTLVVDNAPTLGNGTKPESGGNPKNFALTDFTSVFTDPDAGDKLTSITITTLPTLGTLTLGGVPINAGQVISAANISHLGFTAGAAGIDAFQWTASDGLLSSSAATFTLDINSPPSVANISLTGVTGTPVDISLANFTSAFTDPESTSGGTFGTIQQVKIVSLPANGTLSLGNVTVTKGQIISVANLTNLTYTSKNGFVGTDTFTYNASDGQDFAFSNATVAIADLSTFDVLGNATPIVNGETTPTAINFTDFGSWTILADPSMQNDTRTFTLKNSSNATITLGNITSSNPDFIITSSDPNITLANATIAAGDSLDITVQFDPTVAGKKTSNITITDSANATLFTYEVQGNALHTTVVPTLSFDSNGNPINGVVQVGATQNGSGPGATNGQILQVKYTGYLADGTIFDSSAFHGNLPFPFRLDDHFTDGSTPNLPFLTQDQNPNYNSVDSGVIAGWEYGFQGAQVGEKLTLIIDGNAGYGDPSDPTTIPVPVNSTLIFDVQILAISTKPQLGVVSLNSNQTQFTASIPSGDHTISVQEGTQFILDSSSQSSLSRSYLLLTSGTDTQSGAAVTNWIFETKKPIKITGAGAKNFSFSVSGKTLTVTFDPKSPGVENATVHIRTSDPVHPDFSFDIQGNSAPTVDVATNFGTMKFPKTSVVSGSGQTIKVPVVIVNSGNTPIPANSKTNVQVYVQNTATQALTLLTTLNNLSISGLGAGASKKLNIVTSLPASVTTGSYMIVATTNNDQTLLPSAAVDPTLAVIPEVTASNDNSSISTPFSVVQGTNNLAGSITSDTLVASSGVVSGNITLSLRNTGTIALPKGETATVELVAHPVSDVGTARDQILNPGFSISLSQLAGSRTFTIPSTLATAIPSDSYIIEAIITPDQTLATGAANLTLNADSHGNLITLNT